MTTTPDVPDLDTTFPGVTAAFESLRSTDRYGLQTSNGNFYNHTFFGRDASMAAKFVSDFDPDIVTETILALVRLQGARTNSLTQEEPGRIHHELRNFNKWHGTFMERLPFLLLGKKWDIKNERLLTYFSLDTTASFIRLTHKHVIANHSQILDITSTNQHGEAKTIADAVASAADWIVSKIGPDGLIGEPQTNDAALPFQTFQDSLYARADGTLADFRHSITYIEVQAFAADALADAAELLPDYTGAAAWRHGADRLRQAFLSEFIQPDGYFASAKDSKGLIDIANVSTGWTLNTSIWDNVSDEKRKKHVTAIVKKLFSDEFLTTVGLRTRAKNSKDPVKWIADYHGSETVWPMFTFMVIEGLRRQRLHGLANQLEARLCNGLNAAGDFPEFIIVKRDGTIIRPTKTKTPRTIDAQMVPESYIGFSVVPAIVMARRIAQKPRYAEPNAWQKELDEEILSSIPMITRMEASEAKNAIGTVEYRRFRRWIAGVKVMYYFWSQRKTFK